MSAIIEIKNVTKSYGSVVAVREASLTVEAGEVVGFVGLNGAGKSTAINLLLGFQRPTEGEVRLFDALITPATAHKSHRRVGFASGDMSLFDDMTGRHYLNFVARLHKGSINTKLFASLVERFEPQLDKKLSTLSRGNKQKIALIAAFMMQPELVILDEPSSGLDPLMQQRFLDLVREQSLSGVTIFMSSHYLNEVIDVCTRVVLIKNGEIVKDLPAADLERSGGKLVRVVTGQHVTPPKSAESIKETVEQDKFALEFIYKDKPLRLQEWLGSLPHLKDLTISDHTPEFAFADLYQEEATDV